MMLIVGARRQRLTSHLAVSHGLRGRMGCALGLRRHAEHKHGFSCESFGRCQGSWRLGGSRHEGMNRFSGSAKHFRKINKFRSFGSAWRCAEFVHAGMPRPHRGRCDLWEWECDSQEAPCLSPACHRRLERASLVLRALLVRCPQSEHETSVSLGMSANCVFVCHVHAGFGSSLCQFLGSRLNSLVGLAIRLSPVRFGRRSCVVMGRSVASGAISALRAALDAIWSC